MSLTCNLILNAYSIAILIVIYIHASKHNEKVFLQDRLYTVMLRLTLLMLIIDIFSRFDGNPGSIYAGINSLANLFIFMLNPIVPALWLLYVHYQVFREEKQTKRLVKPLFCLLGVNVVMTILSGFFNWFYSIDSENVYHRGPLFLIPALLTLSLTLVSLILIIFNRKRIEKKHYNSLLFFVIPPLACIILQIIFYGVSLVLNGLTLSLLIVFFTIQNHRMDTDYLTGVYNRKRLEAYMNEKILSSTKSKTFSAILIDLDNFKTINDTFGHDMGDEALQISTMLLKSCFRSNEFIARYGGDEFYLILNLSKSEQLEEAVGKIKKCLERFNRDSGKPYRLGFSMGWAVYDYDSHMTVEEFQKQIDILMYADKKGKVNLDH